MEGGHQPSSLGSRLRDIAGEVRWRAWGRGAVCAVRAHSCGASPAAQHTVAAHLPPPCASPGPTRALAPHPQAEAKSTPPKPPLPALLLAASRAARVVRVGHRPPQPARARRQTDHRSSHRPSQIEPSAITDRTIKPMVRKSGRREGARRNHLDGEKYGGLAHAGHSKSPRHAWPTAMLM